MNPIDRRSMLTAAGMAGFAAALPGDVFAQAMDASRGGNAIPEVVNTGAPTDPRPKHHIKFAVIGLDHNHIYAMTAAVIRGGGELVALYATDPAQIASFRAKFGDVKLARSEAEILDDPAIQLVAGAPIPDLRAPLGIRAMRAGKDFLGDKPAITTLKQLADVRRTIRETGRKFAIMYSERLEVPAAIKAGQLIDEGAIGRVIQTINIAPHQINPASRPAWFWEKARYGGILTDIGSHQAEQFVYFTRSTRAKVVASQTGNIAHPDHPLFEDFGDMVMSGNGGTGYVRVDWFTPNGLGTWGDGRLFVLGTEGYIELRKYADPAGKPGSNHLFIVDRKSARYLDCSKVYLPFGPQFVTDVVERTQVAQDQEQALLAAELVLTAQKNATRPVMA